MAANREWKNTSNFRNQRSTITPRSVAKPQYNPPPQAQPPLLPLPEEKDLSIMDALCLGTCQGPPCTCMVGELATSSISISPTEADLYLNLFSEAATATATYNGLFAEAATATSSDTATMPYILNEPRDFNKTSFNFSSDEVKVSQPKRNSSELINCRPNKKEICSLSTSIQTSKNERPLIRPRKIYDAIPEPSSVKKKREVEDEFKQDLDWGSNLEMAIKEIDDLECEQIDSSNTMLKDATISKLQRDMKQLKQKLLACCCSEAKNALRRKENDLKEALEANSALERHVQSISEQKNNLEEKILVLEEDKQDSLNELKILRAKLEEATVTHEKQKKKEATLVDMVELLIKDNKEKEQAKGKSDSI